MTGRKQHNHLCHQECKYLPCEDEMKTMALSFQFCNIWDIFVPVKKKKCISLCLTLTVTKQADNLNVRHNLFFKQDELKYVCIYIRYY